MITRRTFLNTTAAGLTVLPSIRSVRASEANERLNLAVFGTKYNAEHMLKAAHIHNVRIVALCDPDAGNIAKAFSMWNETAAELEKSGKPEHKEWIDRYRRLARGEDIKIHSDFRQLMDDMNDSIDAVMVSHYDHLHAVTCGPALRAGKPVFSERPLGVNLSEARALRALAAETGLPTSYRSPGTTEGEFRRALELVEDGAIGEVEEVHVWFKRGGPDRGTLPEGTQPVPDGLNWDHWLGPLPWRDYHPEWMTYAHWRETSSGGLGTFGPHTTIFPFLALKLRSLWDRPAGASSIRVVAECSSINQISFPKWERVRWEIPSREDMPSVVITWHHGPELPPGSRDLIHDLLGKFGITSTAGADDLMKTAGSLLIGSDGAFLGNDHSTRITALPAAKFEAVETKRPQRMPSGQTIYHDWIAACRGEKPHILATFDHGGPLSELLMLGNIATRYPGETLAYDPAVGRIVNNPDANIHLSSVYREGWTL